jgi:hypothetical protein
MNPRSETAEAEPDRLARPPLVREFLRVAGLFLVALAAVPVPHRAARTVARSGRHGFVPVEDTALVGAGR